MTDGGYTRAEAWNLQLQGRVRDLEADLAAAERLLLLVIVQRGKFDRNLAKNFVNTLSAKRRRTQEQAVDIAELLEETLPEEAGKPERSEPASEPAEE